MKRTQQPIHRGFTLIELLVVIDIIAILAGLLFPVFARAKAAAKDTTTLSNLKQLIIANVIFADEHNGVWMLPARAADPNYPGSQWLGALGRQLATAHAMELALLGDERLPASRLAEMGWLNRVVDDGNAFDFAIGWAERLAALAPGALRRFKELLRAAGHLSPADA